VCSGDFRSANDQHRLGTHGSVATRCSTANATISRSRQLAKRLWLRQKGDAEVVGEYSGTLLMGAAQKGMWKH